MSPKQAPARRNEAALARLTRLHPKLIDLSLGRIERLLESLGHPERHLPPVVHVAGTNGKGSTLAFIRSIAETAGLRTHVYTSPHLVRFNERIVVAGEEIEDDDLADILEECESANGGEAITFFEVTTAAAFLAFARSSADLALIETGLGGRFDATNVIARPALTAITPVSIDHTHFLGETIPEIAFEKAGILKPGVSCVVGAQLPEAAQVIGARADEVGAQVLGRDDAWRIEGSIYSDPRGAIDIPTPGLAGRHQVENAAQAVACTRFLPEFEFREEDIVAGIRNASWPARLQPLDSGKLSRMLPENWQLWLDGGHNASAATVLARVLADWGDKPVHLVIGMLRTRDPVEFLTPLAPYVKCARTVSVPDEESSLSADELTVAAREVGIDTAPARNVTDAVLSLADKSGGRILICGSLYLAGSVLADS